MAVEYRGDIVITCDACVRGEVFEAKDSTPTEAKREAAQRSWSFANGKAWCPLCNPMSRHYKREGGGE